MLLPYWHGIFKIVERTTASDQNPKGPGRSSKIEGAQNKERVGCRRVKGRRSRALSNGLFSVAYQPHKVSSSVQPRLPVTGVPAKEYVLRRVVSRRVELRSVELTSEASSSRASVTSVVAGPAASPLHVGSCVCVPSGGCGQVESLASSWPHGAAGLEIQFPRWFCSVASVRRVCGVRLSVPRSASVSASVRSVWFRVLACIELVRVGERQ